MSWLWRNDTGGGWSIYRFVCNFRSCPITFYYHNTKCFLFLIIFAGNCNACLTCLFPYHKTIFCYTGNFTVAAGISDLLPCIFRIHKCKQGKSFFFQNITVCIIQFYAFYLTVYCNGAGGFGFLVRFTNGSNGGFSCF